MGAFDALRIAGSGLGMHQSWLDALAHNIANADTVRPTSQNAFQAQMVVAGARTDGGVDVQGVALSDPDGRPDLRAGQPAGRPERLRPSPGDGHERADEQLIMAQRGFQASAQVTKYAQDTYTDRDRDRSAMSIGGIESLGAAGFSPYVAPQVEPPGRRHDAGSAGASARPPGRLRRPGPRRARPPRRHPAHQ